MLKIENVTPDAEAATRVHIIDDDTIWLDTDIGERDGLCIGTGATRDEAIRDAIGELLQRAADLDALTYGQR